MDNRSTNDKSKEIITDIEDQGVLDEGNTTGSNHDIDTDLSLTPKQQAELDAANQATEDNTTETPEQTTTPQDNKPTQPQEPKTTPSPEAQILNEKTKQMSQAAATAATITQPTEQEMVEYVRSDGIDWNDLTNVEKLSMKKAYVAEKKAAVFHNAALETNKIDEWSKKVGTFLDENTLNQTNKQIIGREEEFRNFALQEKHRGVDISVLIGSFLYANPMKKRSNVTIFNTNGGGTPDTTPKNPDVITDPRQAAMLRKTNMKEYMQKIKEGKIKLQA